MAIDYEEMQLRIQELQKSVKAREKAFVNIKDEFEISQRGLDDIRDKLEKKGGLLVIPPKDRELIQNLMGELNTRSQAISEKVNKNQDIGQGHGGGSLDGSGSTRPNRGASGMAEPPSQTVKVSRAISRFNKI